jgi:DNA repair protein RadC
VFELAAQVLCEFKGFAGLQRADAAELKRIKDLGPAKRAELAVVVEMARRALAQPLRDAPVFDAPQRVKYYAALHLGGLSQEVFAVLLLDGQHPLNEFERLFDSALPQTSGYPREVVRQALRHNAGAVTLAHNHPSGFAEPSRADEFLTQTIKSALQLVDVRVLDHLVVGQGSVISFAERGQL